MLRAARAVCDYVALPVCAAEGVQRLRQAALLQLPGQGAGDRRPVPALLVLRVGQLQPRRPDGLRGARPAPLPQQAARRHRQVHREARPRRAGAAADAGRPARPAGDGGARTAPAATTSEEGEGEGAWERRGGGVEDRPGGAGAAADAGRPARPAGDGGTRTAPAATTSEEGEGGGGGAGWGSRGQVWGGRHRVGE